MRYTNTLTYLLDTQNTASTASKTILINFRTVYGRVVKGKGSPYSITVADPGSWQSLRGLLPISLLGEQ